MKHLKDGALSYLFYLVGTFIFLIAVMTLDGSMTSPFSIRLSNILNYIDLGSLVFILAFCLLALACTKTMRPLKDAFVFMFQEQDYTVQQLSEYLLSIKVAAFAALTGGGMSFVVQIIKMLKHGFRRGSFMGRVSHQYCYDFFGVFVGASYDFNANLCSFSAELVPCQTTRKDAEGSGVPQE